MTSLVLIGARCAGKTTIGRRLADSAAVPFVDLDDLVLQDLGATSATEVFGDPARGESTWRAAESRQLRLALERSATERLVIATGGGVVCATDNRQALIMAASRGDVLVLWLAVSGEVSRTRLAADSGDRPPLRPGGDVVAEALEVAATRAPLYQEVADAQVDADQRIDSVIASIWTKWG
ncbi:MAG: hypothetical protein MK101_03925 [Phycisphaerales bacterium]|nr:hypothetical protein [Phycisphaerales bacterium]